MKDNAETRRCPKCLGESNFVQYYEPNRAISNSEAKLAAQDLGPGAVVDPVDFILTKQELKELLRNGDLNLRIDRAALHLRCKTCGYERFVECADQGE